MDRPIVSIIIPCYNSQKYLYRCMSSILSQSYEKIEVISINDGSTDDTEKMLLEYKERFMQRGYTFMCITQKNKGVGGALNTGLKLVRGEYFTYIDPDDYYAKDYVEESVEYLRQHPKYSILRCDGYRMKDTIPLMPTSTMAQGIKDKFKEDIFINCLEIKDYFFGFNMIRTDDFDKVNPRREIYESREGQNWQICLPVYYHYKSGFLDKKLVYCVSRTDSDSRKARSYCASLNRNDEFVKLLCITLKSMKIPEETKYIEMVRRRFTKIIFYLAYNYSDNKKLNECHKELERLNYLRLEDKIYYLCAKNMFLRVCLRVVVLLVRILRKILRILHLKQ